VPAKSPAILHNFFLDLRREVLLGNPFLEKPEQAKLEEHHCHIKNAGIYSPELVWAIYQGRRKFPVNAVLESPGAIVLDAGCGCGSDTILFAALDAEVVAVNSSSEELTIAEKRARYYEKILNRDLNIRFVQADLNDYVPEGKDVSLTWLASILAVIEDQETFLKRIFHSTRPGGRVVVVDYNLQHPPFLWNEWHRRKRALTKSPEFARRADFWGMVRRKGREGARFFPANGDGLFDDVQFFTPGTLKSLLRQVGFQALPPRFTGCAPPLFHKASVPLEHLFSRIPGWNALGRAYLITGIKG
jgi:SAM-dependent methyltransferase